MAGRPPKPTALKQIQGTLRPDRMVNEPCPERVMPAMPRGLPKHAKRFWKDHAERLERLGLLTEIDGPAFLFMAIQYSFAREAAETIQSEGRDARTATRDFKDYANTLFKLMREFGMTPASRSRINLESPEPVDELEQFLNASKG